MTENKRYNIKPSNIVEDAFYIKDDKREHSFPTVDDKSHLIMYEKALNEQEKRIETLKEDVEIILDYVLNKGKFAMTVKEQKAHNRLRGFVRGDVE